MSIKKIIEKKIRHLEKINSQSNDAIKLNDCIILAYTQKVIKDLKKILNQESQSDEDLIKETKLFLENNWNLIKGSLLSYTALPKRDVTLCLFDIADYIAKNDEKIEKSSLISLLMPAVFCDSLGQLDRYPNLDLLDKDELLTIVQTHVLSKNNNYLIPVSLLADDRLDKADFEINVQNPYYDIDDRDLTAEYLSQEELKLLSTHSNKTKAIWDARSQYKTLAKDKNTLLGQLNILSKALLFHSEKGIGSEVEAGDGSYTAILSFNEYWQKLSEPSREYLPAELLSEIDKILRLASPSLEKEKNTARNHTRMTEFCLATRRAELQRAITGQEEKLDVIRLTAEERESQIAQVKGALEKAKKDGSYSGWEQRGITTQVLSVLKINLEFSSFSELTSAFHSVNAKEIANICALKGIPEKIITTISNIKNLVQLTLELNGEALRSLLSGIKKNITNVIKSPKNFQSFLIPLSINQCKVVCESLKKQLPSIIKSGADFADVLEYLTVEQCTKVCEAIKKQLPSLIKSGADFASVLEYLTVEQCTKICEAIKKQLPLIIKSSKDFAKIRECLSSEKSLALCERLKRQLSSIKQCIGNYETQLEHLNKRDIKETDPYTVAAPNEQDSEEYLKQVLLRLKNLVEKQIWNKQAIHLFKRPPDGIQKLRKLLADTNVDNFAKFGKLYVLLKNKCENPSCFRKNITRNFYKELLNNFQNFSDNFDAEENERILRSC